MASNAFKEIFFCFHDFFSSTKLKSLRNTSALDTIEEYAQRFPVVLQEGLIDVSITTCAKIFKLHVLTATSICFVMSEAIMFASLFAFALICSLLIPAPAIMLLLVISLSSSCFAP